MNTMWSFDDFFPENGVDPCSFPGSHRWEPGRAPTPDDESCRSRCRREASRSTRAASGTAAARTAPTGHVSASSSSTRPAWLRAQENHVIGVPPEVVATLPERLQELLGYNIYPPFMGYVDGRHPRRFLPAQT